MTTYYNDSEYVMLWCEKHSKLKTVKTQYCYKKHAVKAHLVCKACAKEYTKQKNFERDQKLRDLKAKVKSLKEVIA